MLKAYAIALALTTAAPVATQSVETAKAPEANKTVASTTQTQAIRASSIRI